MLPGYLCSSSARMGPPVLWLSCPRAPAVRSQEASAKDPGAKVLKINALTWRKCRALKEQRSNWGEGGSDLFSALPYSGWLCVFYSHDTWIYRFLWVIWEDPRDRVSEVWGVLQGSQRGERHGTRSYLCQSPHKSNYLFFQRQRRARCIRELEGGEGEHSDYNCSYAEVTTYL